MKNLTFILLLLAVTAHAQTDTLGVKAYDSLSAQTQLDQLDSIQRTFTFKSDSLRQSYSQQKEKINKVKLRYLAKIDSVKQIQPKTNLPRNPLDTLALPDPGIAQYTKKLDSLDRKLESIQQTVTTRIDSLKGQVTQQFGKLNLPKGSEGKVAGLTAAMDKVNIPAFDVAQADKVGLNNITADIPDLSGVGNLPSANMPDVDVPDLNTNLPNASLNSPDLKGKLPGTDLNTGKINEITGQTGEIQKQVKDATASQEALGKTLETKASEHVKGLPQEKFPEVPGMPNGVPKTGTEAKEQLAQIAKKEAMNHFAGKEAVLTTAMDKMSEYKQKYSSVSSLKDIKDEKHYNELKGKPLRERLVPAVTFQFQSWQDFMLDINPSMGYKITSHLTAGIGWNQRIAFNVSQSQFNEHAGVYGIRTYGEYTFKKGFGFRLDIESMNTPAKEINQPPTDVAPPRDWVWGALIGVKQKYPIYKRLKGNAQLMYNIFDKDHRSPYLDRVNFRMGLEFTFKKKKKAPAVK